MSIAGCDVPLVHGLRAEEADRLTADLHQRGVAASKLDDASGPARYRIEVPSSSVETAVAALTARTASCDVPNERSGEDDAAPLVSTHSDQQLRASRALAVDLARTIELLPGVLRARVHVSLPAANANLDNIETHDAPRAAVLLLLRAAQASQVRDQVRKLVAGTVPGLSAEAITIVDTLQPEASLTCAELTRIGPVSVTRATADTLKIWLVAALCLHMLLALGVLLLLNRARRAANSLDVEPP